MTQDIIPATDQKKPILWEVLALVFIFLVTWIPRAAQLDQFVTADEHLWLGRSANFYTALSQRDFANTFQKEHPGVTAMWAGTAAYLLEYPEYRGAGVGQQRQIEFNYFMQHQSKVSPLAILQTARLALVTIVSLVLSAAYLFARRLVGLLPAVLGFTLLALDPFLLALTRVLHLDALLACFFFLSLLSFVSYLTRRNILDLIVSGCAAGFCWLTKSPGFLLGLVVIAVALVAWSQSRKAAPPKPISFGNLIQVLAVWGIAAGVVYFVFWPAMWVDPAGTLMKVLAEAQGYAETGHTSSVFYNGVIFADGEIGGQYLEFYPLTFLWRTTPIILAGLIMGIWGFFARKKPFTAGAARLTTIGLLIGAVVFTGILTLGSKKFDRYLIPVYLPLDLLAGMGWAALAYWLGSRLKPGLSIILPAALLISAVAAQAWLALSAAPYYFTYYNPILGGSAQAPQVMQIGWGEGLNEAAAYLNAKPGADEMKVYSWYSDGSFSYFFEGQSFFLGPLFPKQSSDWDDLFAADYLVVYIHQWQRNLPARLLEALSSMDPEHSIWIDGLEYARIYKLH